jgi:predicted glycosyltransferase
MHVLFDVSHPAHVHLFRHAITALQDDGHETTVLSRRKDVTTDLLDAYGIEHSILSTMGSGPLGLATEWMAREVRTISQALETSPDVIVSRLNPPAAHASTVLGCPSIVFDDSEAAVLPARMTHPFADVICTPERFSRDLGDKQRRYRGCHELAYLHPNRFDPDPDALVEHGIDPDDHYSVLRFVSWGAHHDVNQEGLSMAGKRNLVEMLADRGDVYITAEDELPSGFEEYRLPVPPEKIHQLMYHANIYVGDSQTMATEAAILGTPAVRCNSFAGDADMSNFVLLQSEYGLLRSNDDESEAINTVEEYLDRSGLQEEWEQKRRRLGDEMIDVTAFMLDVIEEEAS